MTFRRLFGFLRPYRGQVIVSTLLAIGSQVAVLTIPFLTGRAIDATQPGHRDRSALMLNAGLIVVSTTNAIGLADGAAVQALIPDSPLLLIDIDPDGSSAQDCDLRIRGTEPEAEVIAKINDLLAARKITTLG